MDAKRIAIWVGVFMVVLVIGCASGNYGTMRAEEDGVTPNSLLSNLQKYNTYYAGATPSKPIAVLFDPKNDGKNLEVGPRWGKVTDENAVKDMVDIIRMQPGIGVNVPRVWRILGPDGSVYGYVYTLLVGMTITVIDANTMRVESIG